MKKIAIITLLAWVALFAGCMTPQTEAERDHQMRAEEQRRLQAINTGH